MFMRPGRIAVAALAFVLCSGFLGLFEDDDEGPKPPESPAPTLPSIPYDVVVNGPADETLKERITGELSLEKRKAKGAPSMAVLQSRLDNDLARTQEVMRAFGYYDGTVAGAITQGTPMRATLTVEQGTQYKIGSFRVVWQGAAPTRVPETIAVGLPASGQNIVNAGDRIIAELKADGHFDAAMVERRVVLDKASATVDVTVTLSAGPVVTVGSFHVAGNEEIPAHRIIRLAKLEVGELLTPTKLKKAEDNLVASALFDSARADAAGSSAARPVKYTVEERLFRTISGAAKYSFEDGVAVEATWEHRNLFGDAEKLRASLQLGTLRQSLDVAYREYDFFFDDHTLLANFTVANETVDGLEYQEVALIGMLETELWDKFIVRVGGSLEYVRDGTVDEGQNFALIGLRAEASYDATNSLLDPTEGWRANLRINPYTGTNGDLRTFTIVEAISSGYLPLDEDDVWVLAGRVRAGSVIGEERDRIPVAKRFFAGGGGSIRGFSYKRAGPIDEDDVPIGGSSVVELNGEVRWRINEDFGAVAFVDAGGAFPELSPVEDDQYFVGVGLGGRYYSPIGPVRLDVAVPVEGRDGEPDFQIYISIGQAF